jgi:hypothetical protein
MRYNKIKICAAVLVCTAITAAQVQAAGKGASTFAPGHQAPVAGEPGKSGNAPGDLKHDPGTAAKNAKTLAPGHKK